MSTAAWLALGGLWLVLWNLFLMLALQRINDRRWDRFWNGDGK